MYGINRLGQKSVRGTSGELVGLSSSIGKPQNVRRIDDEKKTLSRIMQQIA